jgi:hypothetical protein
MRSTILIITAFSLMASCKLSPDEKAKKAIREELRVTLHDYKSYESVQYGKLDSDFSSVFNFPEYKKLSEDLDQTIAHEKEHFETMKIYAGSIYSFDRYRNEKRIVEDDLEKMIRDTADMGNLKRSFRPNFVGWQIEHSYRARSLAGNLGIHHYLFHLDSALTKVLSQDDISESAGKKN